ncbi:glycerol-3-phosphate 1-O-acyltransferase PlsY [Myxococcota bacterium]|nr:glycerol-3-phosphate 1-O-acyltransferase PlsY [Myxococcota bacterium]
MIWLYGILAGYLAGSLPTGVLIGRFTGVDPRRKGSGNIGFSNVLRTQGRRWGLVALLIDVSKGALPVYLSRHDPDLAAAVGLAAVLGHCFPIWLRFRGGKGVATAFGVMLAFAPAIAFVTAALWLVLTTLTRVPTYGSLAAAVGFILLTRLDAQPEAVQGLSVIMGLIILARHRVNLQRLWAKPTPAVPAQRKQRKRQTAETRARRKARRAG